MLRMKLLLSVLLTATLLSASVGNAFAVTIPTFPLCTNPQGQVKISYDNGAHGVPGDGAAYSGKDTVYTLSDATLTQCLCTTGGEGIQTNWWKASALTQGEKDILISQGWILIPNGTAWGLDPAPYLAQNISYSCGSSVNSGGVGGVGDGRSDGLGCASNDCSAKSSQGQVLGVSTQAILGLASTGNMVFIVSVFLIGIALVLTGFTLSFKKRK